MELIDLMIDEPATPLNGFMSGKQKIEMTVFELSDDEDDDYAPRSKPAEKEAVVEMETEEVTGSDSLDLTASSPVHNVIAIMEEESSALDDEVAIPRRRTTREVIEEERRRKCRRTSKSIFPPPLPLPTPIKAPPSPILTSTAEECALDAQLPQQPPVLSSPSSVSESPKSSPFPLPQPLSFRPTLLLDIQPEATAAQLAPQLLSQLLFSGQNQIRRETDFGFLTPALPPPTTASATPMWSPAMYTPATPYCAENTVERVEDDEESIVIPFAPAEPIELPLLQHLSLSTLHSFFLALGTCPAFTPPPESAHIRVQIMKKCMDKRFRRVLEREAEHGHLPADWISWPWTALHQLLTRFTTSAIRTTNSNLRRLKHWKWDGQRSLTKPFGGYAHYLKTALIDVIPGGELIVFGDEAIVQRLLAQCFAPRERAEEQGSARYCAVYTRLIEDAATWTSLKDLAQSLFDAVYDVVHEQTDRPAVSEAEILAEETAEPATSSALEEVEETAVDPAALNDEESMIVDYDEDESDLIRRSNTVTDSVQQVMEVHVEDSEQVVHTAPLSIDTTAQIVTTTSGDDDLYWSEETTEEAAAVLPTEVTDNGTQSPTVYATNYTEEVEASYEEMHAYWQEKLMKKEQERQERLRQFEAKKREKEQKRKEHVERAERKNKQEHRHHKKHLEAIKG